MTNSPKRSTQLSQSSKWRSEGSNLLLVLEAVLRQSADKEVSEVLRSWFGWRKSTRDLALPGIGVEIKTTTRSSSTHEIQGLHQLELVDNLESGELEKRLFLVSVGIEWAHEPSSNTYTLPFIVDSVLDRLRVATSDESFRVESEKFLSNVASYGVDGEAGYDHRAMSERIGFLRPLIVRFVRAYDMSDDRIEVLRFDDLTGFRHVVRESLTLQISLPSHVHGNVNPTSGLNQAAGMIMDTFRQFRN
jgi:hypothetical protein